VESREDKGWFGPGQGPGGLVTPRVPRMDIGEGNTGALMLDYECLMFERFVLDVGPSHDCISNGI